MKARPDKTPKFVATPKSGPERTTITAPRKLETAGRRTANQDSSDFLGGTQGPGLGLAAHFAMLEQELRES